MRLKFDVFGKKMSVSRKDGQWLLFNESVTGLKARVYDVVIPSELQEDEIATYLDDIYHEYSSEGHTKVERLK